MQGIHCMCRTKVVLHQIPSGVFHPGIVNLIGNNGVVLDPVTP